MHPLIAYRFLQPLDVLFVRGNRPFGDPGSFGESLMPPWPSVAAGALRSQILARDGTDLAAFAAGRLPHPDLGTPQRPGTFTLTAFQLARLDVDGGIDAIYAPPADLVVARDPSGALAVQRLSPRPLAAGILASAPLPKVPVLAEPTRRKAATGLWLTQAGWTSYINGATPTPGDFIEHHALWQLDPRIGVGLDPVRHRADDGKLFSPQAMAPRPGVGFLVGVAGAEPPTSGTLRLGGDGRGAAVSAAAFTPPQPDLEAIVAAGRCRIALTTPGIFSDGWRLPRVDGDGRWRLNGVGARLVCAAVPRADVVSGWDLAQWQPKAAKRAAPTGSVYWLEDVDPRRINSASLPQPGSGPRAAKMRSAGRKASIVSPSPSIEREIPCSRNKPLAFSTP